MAATAVAFLVALPAAVAAEPEIPEEVEKIDKLGQFVPSVQHGVGACYWWSCTETSVKTGGTLSDTINDSLRDTKTCAGNGNIVIQVSHGSPAMLCP